MKTYLDCIPCFFRQALDAAISGKLSTKVDNAKDSLKTAIELAMNKIND